MYGLDPLTRQCTYSTPCGWCAKWDKKCDKKIECGDDDKFQRGLRAQSDMYDDHCHMPNGLIRKTIKEVVDLDESMSRLKEVAEEKCK